VESHEEGTAVADLPRGVYGFTGSPALAAPLFAERRYRNFEIHHLSDGSVAIIGFVSTEHASRLASATETDVDVTVYPDAETGVTELVAISYECIASHRQYSIRNASGMNLRVRAQLGTHCPPNLASTAL
jgi:hypothetical protein